MKWKKFYFTSIPEHTAVLEVLVEVEPRQGPEATSGRSIKKTRILRSGRFYPDEIRYLVSVSVFLRWGRIFTDEIEIRYLVSVSVFLRSGRIYPDLISYLVSVSVILRSGRIFPDDVNVFAFLRISRRSDAKASTRPRTSRPVRTSWTSCSVGVKGLADKVSGWKKN